MVRHRGVTFVSFVAALGCALAVALAAPAWSAEFPAKGKAIQLIVTHAAGGPNDVMARTLASGLEKELGSPVVVVNKPGANTQVGMTFLSQSKPDGYTWSTVSFPTTIGAYLDTARKATYNRKSFDALALHVWDAAIMAVKADSPFKGVQDLVNAAKANPGKITTSSGIMNDDQFSILMLQKAAGIKLAQVTFASGTAPAITALLGGKIDVFTGNVADMRTVVKSGQARILGIMDDEESEFFPGVKTFAAQGYKVYNSASRGYVMPAGVPKEVVAKLNGAIEKVVSTAEHKKRLADLSLQIKYMDAAAFGKYWDEYEAQVVEFMKLAKGE
ncbi:MAG: tripartite tricarboxylate transporter substrate binding protein [Candidatus Methylomirabilota bacterium]